MPASEERSLHEFPSAMSILATTLLWVSTVSSGSTSGYDSEKTTAGDLALAILGDFEFTQDLFTNVKTIFGAINSIMCLYGNTVPSSSQGTDGQFYVKYTSSGGVDTVDGLYWKINDDWIEVSTGGGGGGATVTLGTTVPSDSTGSNGDLYVQYDSVTYAVIEYFVKINNSWRKSPYSRVVALTQAEYDLITPDPSTLYIITDAQSSYQTKEDSNLQTTATTVVGAINELNSGKADASTTYTKTEVDSALSDKANSVDFDGCKFQVITIGSNSTANTPNYTEICTAIIGRGQAGMFVATNNGVVAILDNQLIRTARVPSGNTQYMSIQNNSSATVVALIIYK